MKYLGTPHFSDREVGFCFSRKKPWDIISTIPFPSSRSLAAALLADLTSGCMSPRSIRIFSLPDF